MPNLADFARRIDIKCIELILYLITLENKQLL